MIRPSIGVFVESFILDFNQESAKKHAKMREKWFEGCYKSRLPSSDPERHGIREQPWKPLGDPNGKPLRCCKSL